jgi:hypothetical protein
MISEGRRKEAVVDKHNTVRKPVSSNKYENMMTTKTKPAFFISCKYKNNSLNRNNNLFKGVRQISLLMLLHCCILHFPSLFFKERDVRGTG